MPPPLLVCPYFGKGYKTDIMLSCYPVNIHPQIIVIKFEHNLGTMGMALGIIVGELGNRIIGRFWSIFPSSLA